MTLKKSSKYFWSIFEWRMRYLYVDQIDSWESNIWSDELQLKALLNARLWLYILYYICLTTVLSFYLSFYLTFCPIILSNHSFVLSFHHLIYHSVVLSLSFCLSFSLSIVLSIVLTFCSIILLFHSVVRTFCHSIILSFYRSIYHSV